MNVVLEKLPKSEIKLIVELTDDELASYREKAANFLSQKIEIPGFRKGHAPAFSVESKVGKEAFFKEVLRFALPDSFSKAVQEQKLQIISRPRITITSQYPLKYEAIASLMPQINLKDYGNVKVDKAKIEVSEKELEGVINEMRKYHAVMKPRQGAAQKGDKVEIDFHGYDAGVSIESTKSRNHPLIIGEGTLVHGFEEQLIGMQAGEKKKFGVTFPKDFHHAPFRGKKIDFEVEMKKTDEVALPLIDEVFVERVMGQKASVQAFSERVKQDIEFEKKREERRRQESQLLEKWLSKADFEVPPTLVEEELDYMISQMAEQLRARGAKPEVIQEQLGKQEKELREKHRKEAEKRVKVRLIIGEILRLENIQVSDEEADVALEESLRTYPEAERSKIRTAYAKNPSRKAQLKNSLKLNKLFNKFLS